MAMHAVAGAAKLGAAAPVEHGKEKFSQVMKGPGAGEKPSLSQVKPEVARPSVANKPGVAGASRAHAAPSVKQASASHRVDPVSKAQAQKAARAIDHVNLAQARLDRV